MKKLTSVLLAASAMGALFGTVARAQTAAAPPAPPATWLSTLKVSGHVDVGASLNPDSPSNGINAGQLYTDKANQINLYSLALTAERDPDTSAKTVDLGFKVQAAYGTDGRYNQSIGLNFNTGSAYQFDIVEAHIDAHIGYGTAAGTELHIGEIPTLEGVEVMDPTGNFFASKSYLYNYGIPLKFTGIMAETHLNPLVDVYYGINSGVNTTLGPNGGADDNRIHFLGGVGLNFKTLTILATTQIGPENYNSNPTGGRPLSVAGNRYLNDVVVTWKINDKLTSITDINYIYDESKPSGAPTKASGGGVTEYLTYALTPTWTLGARVEVWREDQNFYVGNPIGYRDFYRLESGYGGALSAPVLTPTGTNATFGEITIGANYKPANLPKFIAGTTFRPEIRFDSLLTSGKFYDSGAKSTQVTIGLDVVAPLTF